MSGASVRKTLYLDTGRASISPDGDALRVQRPDAADGLIPLRRVDRAVIHDADTALLQACLAIVSRGGTVHFQDAAGNLCGILQQPWAEGTQWARDTARLIEHSSGRAAYRSWLDTQRRHAWSLVFRRNYCGDFETNRKRLVHYLLFLRPEIDATDELDWLEQQTWAWLQATLDRDGLQPIARAVDSKGESLTGALAPCLLIPLFWAYVRWRRCQANSPVHDRTRFFELQARTRLNNQFRRHVRALAAEYHGRRRIEETDLDDLPTTRHLP